MIKLRDYQEISHNETIKHCRKTADFAIHDQSVGAGKTILIAHDVKHVCDKGGHCLVLARQGELVEQDAQDYKSIGGKCSIFSASLGLKSSYYPAVFGSEGSVCRALNNEFKDRVFHFIAIDECHEVDDEEVMDCIESFKSGFNIYENKDENGKSKYSQYSIIITHFLSLNPKLRIIGYSGSPFRGSRSIIGKFWKKKLSEVSTYQLVGKGYLVPPVFGFGSDDDHNYDLKKFQISEDSNSGDFSSKVLSEMQREILKDKNRTQLIIEEVIERTSDRLGVLITCAGKKHCEEVSRHLPIGTWGIVTDDTSTKKRREILKNAYDGKIKYVLQVNCLGQGVNVPIWDTCVILRKIGSLRYLIQLIGRVLRLLKDHQIESGLLKHDGLVLDFTDTLETAGNIYDNIITDAAAAAKAKITNKTVECAACKTENSEYAVRCRGVVTESPDGRCEHYFKFTLCLNCETPNAPTTRTCRNCSAILIDPNAALKNKAYSDADYKPVIKMQLEKNKSGGLVVMYALYSTYHKDGIEFPEMAKEHFSPASDKQFQKARWWKFISDHIQGGQFRRTFAKMNIDAMVRNQAMLDAPTHITHRVNDDGFSIINRKKFRSGREEKAS